MDIVRSIESAELQTRKIIRLISLDSPTPSPFFFLIFTNSEAALHITFLSNLQKLASNTLRLKLQLNLAAF